MALSLALHAFKVVPRASAGEGRFPAYVQQVPLRAFALTQGGTVRATLPGQDQCWAAPPPCTPYPDPGLRLVPRFGRVGFERPVTAP